MIEPAGTFCPPNTFTPSIFGWESRPLRVEPPPFFCAISSSLTRRIDGTDLEFREPLTMALTPLVVLSTAHLKNAHLVVPAVADHFRNDVGPRQQWAAEGH